MDINYEIIGKNIIKYRLQRNMTQKLLANKLEITANSLSKIERAEPKLKPSIRIIIKIADVLDVHVDDLLEGVLVYKTSVNNNNSNNDFLDKLRYELSFKNTNQKEKTLKFVSKYLDILNTDLEKSE